MIDGFGRDIRYLRVSVTDLCNLRCVYCMPEKGVKKLQHEDILSVEEVVEIVRAAAACGITKVRLTGGEPLVRRGITDICRGIAAIPGITELCMTTNGVLLPELAAELKDAGVQRLNISLDSLNAEKYEKITRFGSLAYALKGLEAAKKAGFENTKINCVLMGGVNDGEIRNFVALTEKEDYEVRFIELMPIGECAGWEKRRFIPNTAVLEAVPELQFLGTQGVARLYAVPGWKGRVGLINPVSAHFCPECNRLRLTADGVLKPCLHSDAEIGLRGLHGAELEAAVRAAAASKPRRHHLETGSDSHRNMNMIGG